MERLKLETQAMQNVKRVGVSLCVMNMCSKVRTLPEDHLSIDRAFGDNSTPLQFIFGAPLRGLAEARFSEMDGNYVETLAK